ncbi:uncharacterized protein LOC113565542 [Drosophila persimilis]|uniref:uncharacterized protein LOC113565542 n=1 Tax=Drosophila persimilis TaxID=7234 RepID=UPI000F096BF1|nr:uncharacterized protein LOC113565542 [Drosophila persimilis]
MGLEWVSKVCSSAFCCSSHSDPHRTNKFLYSFKFLFGFRNFTDRKCVTLVDRAALLAVVHAAVRAAVRAVVRAAVRAVVRAVILAVDPAMVPMSADRVAQQDPVRAALAVAEQYELQIPNYRV